MKIILIAGGSRAGLEFFLSLLDGHTEVLQFPGAIWGNKKLIHILSHNNSSAISSNFIKHYQHFFDSRLSTMHNLNNFERHNMLGEDKNQYYLVDKEKFKKNFFEIYKNRQKTKLNNQLYEKLLMLCQAYSQTCGQDISKKKIMVINCHIIEYVIFFVKKIMGNIDFDIIHTI